MCNSDNSGFLKGACFGLLFLFVGDIFKYFSLHSVISDCMIYEVECLFEVSETRIIKAKSKAEAKRLIESGATIGDWKDDLLFEGLISVQNVKRVKI